MAKIGENELKAQIKGKEFSNVYMVYGEENYLKQFYINKIKASVVEPTFEDFNFHSFEGRDANIDDILRDSQMLPMMSEYTCVLVHDYHLEKVQSDVDALKEFFSDVPETTILIFWFDSIVVDDKNSKWKTIIKLFDKAGSVVNLEKKSVFDLAKLVAARAKKKNCTISNELAKYLISVVGTDIKTIYNETDKLCFYVSQGEIKKEHIDKLSAKCLQARVFDLSKCIVKGDGDGAFDVLNSLFYNKEEPVVILSVIASCYIDMYRVKCAKTSNINESELINYFPRYKGKEFVIKNASRDCRNLTINQLRNAIDIISDADVKLKSTGVNERIVLEQTVAMLLNEVHYA